MEAEYRLLCKGMVSGTLGIVLLSTSVSKALRCMHGLGVTCMIYYAQQHLYIYHYE
jgi:hypothetical protein